MASSQLQPTPKIYHGSCHCKAIQYEAEVTLHPSKTGKCNCSICLKSQYFFERPTKFKLISPASTSEISGDYQFGVKETHHYFCKECGVRVFMQKDGEMVDYGDGKGEVNAISLNLHTLDDADLSKEELKCKRFEDWKRDSEEIRDVPWEGGAW